MRPLLHVFGHVHAGRTDFIGWLSSGRERVIWDRAQSALQKGLDRKSSGLVFDLCNLGLWWDLASMVGWSCYAVFWERIWGGEEAVRSSTLMINAAAMYEGTGTLGNAVQVVDI